METAKIPFGKQDRLFMGKDHSLVPITDVTFQCKAGDQVDINTFGRDSSGKPRYSLAVFSDNRKYRFYLRRVWESSLPRIAFIMLNPSTADALKNDPTVARCEERASRLGFGSFSVTNIFAYRSTNPNALTLPNVVPIGDGNDDWIVFAARTAAKIMIGWGNHGKFMNRSENVISMLEDDGRQLFCLGQNKGGCPVHPLYQKYEKPLVRYMQSIL